MVRKPSAKGTKWARLSEVEKEFVSKRYRYTNLEVKLFEALQKLELEYQKEFRDLITQKQTVEEAKARRALMLDSDRDKTREAVNAKS